jgi:hypothetical protein
VLGAGDVPAVASLVMPPRDKALRVLVIGGSAVGGSLLSAIGGVISLFLVHRWLEPPGEMGSLHPWWMIVDPVTLLLALYLALPFALLTFAYGLFALWKTELRRTIPIVIGVGVGSVIVTAPVFYFFSAFFGLLVIFVVMTSFRFAGGAEDSAT